MIKLDIVVYKFSKLSNLCYSMNVRKMISAKDLRISLQWKTKYMEKTATF